MANKELAGLGRDIAESTWRHISVQTEIVIDEQNVPGIAMDSTIKLMIDRRETSGEYGTDSDTQKATTGADIIGKYHRGISIADLYLIRKNPDPSTTEANLGHEINRLRELLHTVFEINVEGITLDEMRAIFAHAGEQLLSMRARKIALDERND